MFFYLCLDKKLIKHSKRWWFETPSRSLWRHCNAPSIRLQTGSSYSTKRLTLLPSSSKTTPWKKWASSWIRKITGCAYAGMPGTFSPPKRVSDLDLHHGTCLTHVPWCMPGSLTSGTFEVGGRENVPGILSACATRNFTYLVRCPYSQNSLALYEEIPLVITKDSPYKRPVALIILLLLV